jgi:hypothetical protein
MVLGVILFFLLIESDGDCIARLRKDLGNFLEYQNVVGSLRAKFGREPKYNFDFGRFTFTFPGLHCPKDEKEYFGHLELSKLN